MSLSEHRVWNPGLQQCEIICSKCKEKYIEDDINWFEYNNNIVCEVCYLEIRGLKTLEELEDIEYDESQP